MAPGTTFCAVMPWKAVGRELAEDGAHTEQDHGDGDAELQPLTERRHQVVAGVAERAPPSV
ncbi:hypothetical protein [Streptomyces sp. KL116D]|uniref:hypothetical protein n=1 Tax=Streptomyces sp. KL116D TaxID=3045152 RepID=UPI0035566A91